MPTLPRRDTDTPRSYAALLDYAAMGAARSLRDLAARYRQQSANGSPTNPPSTRFETLAEWSTSNSWQDRVKDYDDAVAAEEEAQRAKIRAQRRKQLEDQDWDTGNALREVTRAILSEVPKFIRQNVSRVERDGVITEVITLALKAGPGELARAMELASKLQRLSVGDPTEIHAIVERELEGFFDRLRDNLTPEEYARIVALASGETPA